VTVGLLYTHDHIISPTMFMLRLTNSLINRIASVVAMADDFPFFVYNVPTVQRGVVIDMKGVFGAGSGDRLRRAWEDQFFCCHGEYSDALSNSFSESQSSRKYDH